LLSARNQLHHQTHLVTPFARNKIDYLCRRYAVSNIHAEQDSGQTMVLACTSGSSSSSRSITIIIIIISSSSSSSGSSSSGSGGSSSSSPYRRMGAMGVAGERASVPLD
jgi:hypothetical protein